MTDPSPIGKRATRLILANVGDILAEKLPLISYELVMETFDQEGGARMYRLTHSLSPLDKPVYVVVTAEILDENGAQRRIPPHDAEGVSDIDHQLPPIASRFPGINYRGPQGDPVGRMLPPLPPEEAFRLFNENVLPPERMGDDYDPLEEGRKRVGRKADRHSFDGSSSGTGETCMVRLPNGETCLQRETHPNHRLFDDPEERG